jgi:cytolysin-activating lysine-acyltransferase
MIEQNKLTIAQAFGEITWLLTQSATHKHLPLEMLERTIMPPLMLNQFHIFYYNKQPLAFATWAYLTEDIEKAILEHLEAKNPALLDIKAWKSGERLWLMDLICPTATAENKLLDQLINDLTTNVFKGQLCRFIKRNEATQAIEQVYLGQQEANNA